ncbi:MAG: NAD+ synthase [Candidatus Tokpelaia sp. JSC161]|jgi:NAD+ synthase|nr:MAG: NAD+ synthase [Candidatus Tokpelaia sp. JSC161]
MKDFFLAMAQLNPVMGDIAGNVSLARAARITACKKGADLVLFSEMFICGYSPEDMVSKSSFLYACEKAIHELARDTKDGGPGIVIGVPLKRQGSLYNALVLLDKGRIIAERYKVNLPNYDEFNERRVFTKGVEPDPVVFRGISLGLLICEDIWSKDHSFCKKLAEKGAQVVLVSNASPFQRCKPEKRFHILSQQVRESSLPIVYVNQFGGQDELFFDGGSFALEADGTLAFQMKHFEEDLSITGWRETYSGLRCFQGPSSHLLLGLEADYTACMLGLADYVKKNGFEDIVLGLSGGIDSALCAAISVDAIGAEHVRTIMMPYSYTSQMSCDDAAACAHQLGCRYDVLPILGLVKEATKGMTQLFSGSIKGVTEENLQSRLRGTLLMAASNETGAMLITTGNKSEIAVGYATIYGDMNGGFNPIKDIYKMHVYAMSKWRNAYKPQGAKGPNGIVIPLSVLNKAPSAELREGQIDEDVLPSYPLLDAILEKFLEHDMSVDEIINCGYSREVVERIENLLYAAEHKRRQSPPGVKITSKSFGRDRCYPITNRFRTNLRFV